MIHSYEFYRLALSRFQMFKRSGALSGTRRASKKPSPLPKRGTRKEVEQSVKASDKTSGKRTPLQQPTESDADKSHGAEAELENLSDDDNVAEPDVGDNEKPIDLCCEESIQSSATDLAIEKEHRFATEEGESKADVVASSERGEMFPDAVQLPQEREEHGKEADGEIDQSFDEGKEELKLNLEEPGSPPESYECSNETTPIPPGNASLSGDLLIDAEDSETFQDLSVKPDIVSERSPEEPKTLEMKSSDTSGLVSGGVISLQYPDDDARPLGSIQLDDAKTEADQNEDTVSAVFHRQK